MGVNVFHVSHLWGDSYGAGKSRVTSRPALRTVRRLEVMDRKMEDLQAFERRAQEAARLTEEVASFRRSEEEPQLDLFLQPLKNEPLERQRPEDWPQFLDALAVELKNLVRCGGGRCAAGLVVSLAIIGQTYAYTYSAFTGMTGAKMFALAPAVYLSNFSDRSTSGADMVIAYGVLDHLDIYAEPAGFYGLNSIPDVNPYYTSWIMPRFDFGNNNIAAIELGITRDADKNIHFYAGPQYHFSWENDAVAMEANAIFYTPDNPLSYTAGMWSTAILGVVWKAVPDIFHPYLEVDPIYDFGDGGGFDLTMTPGVWLGIPNTSHQASLGLAISGLATEPDFGVVCWYWVSFGGADHE